MSKAHFKSDTIDDMLISWHILINKTGIGLNAACNVEDFRESLFQEQICKLSATHSSMAQANGLFLFVIPLTQLRRPF